MAMHRHAPPCKALPAWGFKAVTCSPPCTSFSTPTDYRAEHQGGLPRRLLPAHPGQGMLGEGVERHLICVARDGRRCRVRELSATPSSGHHVAPPTSSP